MFGGTAAFGLSALSNPGSVNVATQPWVKNFFYQDDYGHGSEVFPKMFLDGKK